MDFELPTVGEGLIDVELVRWLVKPGDPVERGQSLMEVMSDKATMEVTSDFAGRVTDTLAEPGTKIRVGQKVLKYFVDTAEHTDVSQPAKPLIMRGELSGLHTGTQPKPTASPAIATTGNEPAAAPSVRHLARKMNIDLSSIRGTGPAGRILHEDLIKHLQPATKTTRHEPAKKANAPEFDLGKAGTRAKLIGLRRKIAEHMIQSKKSIPHYTYVDECDVTDLVRIRLQLKDTFNKVGVKLTYLPFIIKAVTRALKEIPIVNCTFDEASQEMIMHDQYNIGFAVATPTGLVVPVIKNTDQKDVAAIATEIERMRDDARAGRPKLEDLKGSTYTVTSVGNLGGLISTPIVNYPEVGILGIGKVLRKPVYDDAGNIRPADMLYLSFSFDHRIVDGAVGALFGNAVAKHLQKPATLLLPERFAV